MEKVSDSDNEAILNLIQYQYSPLPALSAYLEKNQISFLGEDYGKNLFRFFFAIFYKLGLSPAPVQMVQEFVNIPHLTNIYTIYFIPIKDFGWLGIMIYSFFIGFIHSTFYINYKSLNSDLMIYLYTWSFIPLIVSSGGETYFAMLSTWLQVFIVGILFTKKL